MRIPIMDVILTENREPVLIKKQTRLYKDLQNICNPKDVVLLMTDVFQMNRQITEQVYLLTMDNKGTPLGFFFLNQGTVNSSLVDTRGIFIRILLTNASKFILIHNHTSGNPFPSSQDYWMTKRLKELSEVMGVTLDDHIIIGNENGDGSYYSFSEQLWTEKQTGAKSENNYESEEILCLQN